MYTLYHIPFKNAQVQEVADCIHKPYPICVIARDQRTKVKMYATERYFILKHNSIKIKR